MSTLADQPAFPRAFSYTEGRDNQHCRRSQTGMTLRQHYAGLAMQGILSNTEFLDEVESNELEFNLIAAKVGELSVNYADALIAELEKPHP